MESGALKGLPRGIAFRLIEAGGLIDRRDVERDLHALSQVERRTLRSFAVRVGVHSVWLPGLQKPRARAFAQAFVSTGPQAAAPSLPLSARALSALGLRSVGSWLVPVEALERMAELRALNSGRLPDSALAELEWTEDQARALISALKTSRAQRVDIKPRTPRPAKDSPFAALAALTTAPPERESRRRRRKA